MIRRAIRECPICENPSVEVLHSQSFLLSDGHPLSSGYEVVTCLGCGFVYADTGTPQLTHDALYQGASKYQSGATSPGGDDKAWDAERLAEIARTISAMLANKSRSILDMGCATGGLLKALGNLGHFSLTGIDPTIAGVEQTRARGVTAHLGSLAAIPRECAQFDVVILSHVLEHVRDLSQAMESLRSLLHPVSLIYLEVLDAGRYADFVSAPFQYFNTEHINHFSGVCLDNLARRAGLVPLKPFVHKTIRSSANSLYPAVYNIYRCARPAELEAQAEAPIKKDAALKDRILDYVSASRTIMRDINSRLARELEGCPEVALWGTGQLALNLLSEEPLSTASIRACIDANPVLQGKRLRDVPVLAPEGFRGADCPIVITSTLHEAEIRRVIRGMGMSNRLISLRPEGSNRPFDDEVLQ